MLPGSPTSHSCHGGPGAQARDGSLAVTSLGNSSPGLLASGLGERKIPRCCPSGLWGAQPCGCWWDLCLPSRSPSFFVSWLGLPRTFSPGVLGICRVPEARHLGPVQTICTANGPLWLSHLQGGRWKSPAQGRVAGTGGAKVKCRSFLCTSADAPTHGCSWLRGGRGPLAGEVAPSLLST